MSILKPLNVKGRRLVLTERIILEAQKHTKSNAEAARFLSVSYNTYKKWAKYYNIFEQHLNQSGVGVRKGWATYKVSIDDIITGKRQPPKRYTLSTLKNRLIAEGYFQEECSHCNYNDVGLSSGKVCLRIDFNE